MVGEIASRYGVSQDAIISLNKLRNTRTLQIGQLLKIPSMDGIVYTPKKAIPLKNWPTPIKSHLKNWLWSIIFRITTY